MAFQNQPGNSWNEPQFDGGSFNAAALPISAIDRKTFITKTYLHLLGAILAFTGLEVVFFKSGIADNIASALLQTGRGGWLLVLLGFSLVSWLASRLANPRAAMPTQYAGLALYIVAQSIIFVPMLWLAYHYAEGAINSAVVCTVLGFVGLTCVAIGTGKDFSFLRGILYWGFAIAIVAIIASAIFGFTLGTFFSVAMVALAGAAILHDTSNVLRVFPTEGHVAASLQLFASVVLMFWYLLRIFMNRR